MIFFKFTLKFLVRINRMREDRLLYFRKKLGKVHDTRQSADTIYGLCRAGDVDLLLIFNRRDSGCKGARGYLLPSVPAWNRRVSDL